MIFSLLNTQTEALQHGIAGISLAETIYPMTVIRGFISGIIDLFKLDLEHGSTLYLLIAFGIVLGSVILFDLLLQTLFRNLLPQLIKRISTYKEIKEINGVRLRRMLGKVARIFTTSLFVTLLPEVFNKGHIAIDLLSALSRIYIVVLVVQVLANILDLARGGMLGSEQYRNNPLVNIFQVIKVIFYFIATLFIISILFRVDLSTLTAGLAGLSAVLMLVFKDSILGFVASVQLSSNDMLRIGDWITVPGHGVDGDVIDISLTTIKVQNFDKTVSTVPPYTLITDSFQNWRPMQESGGRRVKRALYIDMRTVRYADKELLDTLKSTPLLSDYIDVAIAEIKKENREKGVEQSFARRRLTNLGVFRRYIVEYLRDNPHVHKTYTCMVRQLQPTDAGIPLELYFFTNTTVWVEYEGIQSDVFDHLLAVISYFDLAIFQNVNGNDVQNVALLPPSKIEGSLSARKDRSTQETKIDTTY